MKNRFESMAKHYSLFETLIDENDKRIQGEIGRLVREYCRNLDNLQLAVFEGGCGIGNTSIEILRADDRIKLHAVDLDSEMVEMTKHALRHVPLSRMKIEAGDMYDALGRSDAITMCVTSLTLHNIVRIDRRLDTIARMHEKLLPGGVFIDGDKIADDGETDYWKRYHERIQNIDRLIGYGHPDLAKAWKIHEWVDRPNVLSLGAYIHQLKTLGFTNVRVRKQLGLYKIITAVKQ